MTATASCLPQYDLIPDSMESAADEVRAQVWGLLTSLYPERSFVERRRDARYPFPYLIQIVPVGTEGTAPAGEAIAVVGRHLSAQGLGFFHPKPLPFRRVIATIDTGAGAPLAFLMDLSWCRFTRQGWYESGGRFLDAVSPPQGR